MSAEYTLEKSSFRPAASKKIEKGLKRLLFLAGLILGAELVWLLGVSPCIPLSTVDVRGFQGFDGDDVLRFAGIGEGASFVSVNAAEAQKALSGHYLVESAKVVKRFPDRLSIFLEPRRAVAVSLAGAGGRQLPLYCDRQGVVFRIGAAYAGTEENPPPVLPVLSGLIFENPAPGMRLPEALSPLLESLAKLGENFPELLAAVSEIKINRKSFDGFDLILYPAHIPVRVRLENKLDEETLKFVILMLDVFASHPPLPEEIDFRSGIGSYQIKEAPSGQ